MADAPVLGARFSWQRSSSQQRRLRWRRLAAGRNRRGFGWTIGARLVDLTGWLPGSARFIAWSAEVCNHARSFEHDHQLARGERGSSEAGSLAESSAGFARRLDVVEHADEADEGLSTLLRRLSSRGRAACCCERRPPRGPGSAIIEHHLTAFAAYRQGVRRTTSSGPRRTSCEDSSTKEETGRLAPQYISTSLLAHACRRRYYLLMCERPRVEAGACRRFILRRRCGL